MGIFKKVKKAVKKGTKPVRKAVKGTAKKAGTSFARGAKRTYKGTVGKGVRGTPTLKDVLRVARRYNPYVGITEVTRELQKDRTRGKRR